MPQKYNNNIIHLKNILSIFFLLTIALLCKTFFNKKQEIPFYHPNIFTQ